MYAIMFEFIENCDSYGKSCKNDVRIFMESNNFTWKQDGLYFGGETVDVVLCVITIQKLGIKFPYLKNCIMDIRVLRVEDVSDLTPALYSK